MRDESDREFERIVGASYALPGAGRYWPWVACPVVLALAAGAALYPILLPAFELSLDQIARLFGGVGRVLGFAVSGDPSVLDGSAPGWRGPEPPPYARGMAAIAGAWTGAALAAAVEDFVPRWTASARGYEDGLRLALWLPYAVALAALAAYVAWGRSGA